MKNLSLKYMCRLVESIRIDNGKPVNIEYHNRRMTAALSGIYNLQRNIDLEDIIKVPHGNESGILKCRIIYGREIEAVEYIPYSVRIVRSLKLIVDDNIDYSYKYSDRSAIDRLYSVRGDCDDILIVKKGFITDTSYANIIFRKPGGAWITPSTPLLSGTRRQSLLDAGLLTEEPVTPEKIPGYLEARLINAMLGPEDSEVIPVSNIYI